MLVSLGFIKSSSQILIKSLDWEQNKLETKLIDATDLPDFHLQGLLVENDQHFNQLISLLDKEKKFYPILDAKDFQTTLSQFEELPALKFKDLSEKIQSRWLIHQNLSSVEQLPQMGAHLKTLWGKDRISFFEELWYWLQRNLGSISLSLIFNDIENNDSEKKPERPKLIQSLLSGTKKANFYPGGGKEQELMGNYLEKYQDAFEVTEYSAEKGRMVATVQLDKSPVIIMAQVTGLSPIQRSLLKGLFNGIKL